MTDTLPPRAIGARAPRRLLAADLPRVATIHRRAFPESLLSRLSLEAVRRYYDWQLHGPHDAVALAIEEDGAVAAFCFGGVFRGAMSGFVRRNRVYLAMQLLLHPTVIIRGGFGRRLLTALRALNPLSSVRSRSGSVAAPSSRAFGILAIAVDPSLEAQGLGKVLMKEMERIARERGFASLCLTVRADNERAVAFYERLAWYRVSDSADGLCAMAKDIDVPESVAAPARRG